MDLRKKLSLTIGIIWLGFQLYIGLVKPLHPLLQYSLHLFMALSIIFCYFPAGKKWWELIDIAAISGLTWAVFHIFTNFQRLQTRIPYVNPLTYTDIIITIILVAAVLEAIRRTLGYSLFIFMLLVIVYGFFGKYFPGIMRFRGIRLSAFTDLMIGTTDGMFGTPLGTCVNTLYYFILFGVLFAELGGGQILLDLGLRFSNTASGGPGKAAVISSSLLGTISGSAVANVVATGVITIPFMKKAGYSPEQAAAIESVASTGGQIMPPIMGVGAFIMAELLGKPYSEIALSALIPALLYYFSIFLLVDFLGRKQKMIKVPTSIINEKILPRLYLLIPILFIVFSIFRGASLMRTALRGSALTIILSFFNKKYMLNSKSIMDLILKASMQVAKVAVPTAAAGVVIGIVIHSGFAQRLSIVMGVIGGQSITVALLLAMTGCILLGMALPTVAAYIIAAVLFSSTLVRLGIPPLAAHLFLFYFGVIAQITPPVCLASFTAAGIAEANTWKTAWTAFFYALVTFLIPYVFIFKNEILMMGALSKTIISIAVVIIGILFLVSGISGYLFVTIRSLVARGALIIIAILIIIPEYVTSLIGIIVGVLITAYFFLKYRSDTSKNN